MRPARSAAIPQQFENFIRLRSYQEGILFDTRSSSGKPIYHTNVMMSLGDQFAVVCAESIPDAAERSRVMQSLRRSFDVIEISLAQMEQHFCGNILQLRNRDGRAADGDVGPRRKGLHARTAPAAGRLMARS